LALTTLLAGITGNSAKSAAFLTFNTSSLGLEAYHDSSSSLHANITALIPSGSTNPPSITQYLGVHDWYTLHYFSNCSGFFAPSLTNPSILTSKMVNITCHRQFSGYHFSPHDVIQSTLLPGVSGIAETVSTATYQTATWSSLWYAGIGNLAVASFELPWTFTGRRSWLNFWIAWNYFISTVLFLSSSAMVTNTVIRVHNAKGLPGPNPWPGTFLGIMWSTTTLMGIVSALMWVQRHMESSGDCYVAETPVRVEGGEERVEEWKSETTFVEGLKT